MTFVRLAPLAALALLAVGGQAAAAVTPLSYDMLNGNSGTYNYWDQSYSGAGCVTCNNASLTGGLGDLTDGVIAANNWNVDEAPAGNGPYVGWQINPTITFNFAPNTAINSIKIWFDDSNGFGGVSAPGSFDINNVNYLVPEPLGSAPSSFTVSGLGFVGSTFTVKVNRKTEWAFLSEVSFGGMSGAVPEPATWGLMIGGFGLAGAALRRRRAEVAA